MDEARYKARILLRRSRRNVRGVVTNFDWEVCDVEFSAQLRDAEIVGVESADQPRVEIDTFLNSSVDSLDLSFRARTGLAAANIRTVAELARRQPYELLKVKGIGETVLREYARELERHGFYLGMPLN
jgi:DNA-directed RNA polymerase alpha subunit